jgi:hypothetical protein
MATTAGSAGTPIRPLSSIGGSGAAVIDTFPVLAGELIAPGDIIIVDTSGFVKADITDPVAEILGVAMCKKSFTAPATVDHDGSTIPDSAGNTHAVSVALALPGQRFVGTMIDGTTPSDHTGAFSDLHDAYALDQSSQLRMCIDFQDTTAATAYVIAWATPAMDGATPTAAVEFGRNPTVINPRVQFYFIVTKTVFGLV